MANPIRRLVQLILDRKSAADTEAGAKQALGGVDGAVGKLRAGIAKLGAALAAAFAVRKILDFGKAAIAAAQGEERAIASLGTAVRAAGGDFEAMREEVVAAAAAMQDATTVADDQYYEALQRVVVITGDVTAATKNMGLVADVAAAFFDGELGPAADLVAKAMNGNFIALQKMGIQAKSAQEALDVLAQRSLNAAAERANTFAGRTDQLRNSWGDFLESVGYALIGAGGEGGFFASLNAAVKTATNWVSENADAISRWVRGALNVAVTVVDALYRAVRGLAEILAGTFTGAIGLAAKGVSYLVTGYSLAVKGAGYLALALGASGLAGDLIVQAEAADTAAQSIRDWADTAIAAGKDLLKSGATRFTETAFALPSGDAPAAAGAAVTPGGGRPVVSRNAKTETTEELVTLEDQAARLHAVLTEFGAGTETMRTLAALLGEDFNALEAEAGLLENAIGSLASQGFDANDEVLVMMRDRLGEVRTEMELLEEATRMEEDAMKAQAFAAGELASAIGAAMAGGLGPFAKSKAKQNLLEAAELGIRAVIASLTGFGAAKAGAFASAAGKHLAIAAAWGSLGASMGGGGGGGSAVAPSGGGGNAPVTPTVARGTTATAARAAESIAAEVNVYLTGPGFHALNPEVQRVVRGATQEAEERWGNVRVRTHGTG